jgi:hypothetical protein
MEQNLMGNKLFLFKLLDALGWDAVGYDTLVDRKIGGDRISFDEVLKKENGRIKAILKLFEKWFEPEPASFAVVGQSVPELIAKSELPHSNNLSDHVTEKLNSLELACIEWKRLEARVTVIEARLKTVEGLIERVVSVINDAYIESPETK